jgi:hypothetical protein
VNEFIPVAVGGGDIVVYPARSTPVAGGEELTQIVEIGALHDESPRGVPVARHFRRGRR